MGNFVYRDNYAAHQAVVEPEVEDLRLPLSLELDRFSDEQLVYMAEWLQDFRAECLNRVLEFLSRKGCRYRICILDKMINRPELKWCDAAAFYGLSQHKLYDMKREMMSELMGLRRRLGLYERRQKRGAGSRCVEKKKMPVSLPEKQMTFDFYEH